MPQGQQGNVITSSAQVNPSVIESSDILNDSIVDADINSAAAIAGSKLQTVVVGTNPGVVPSTGIVDAHIAAAAAIDQSKLSLLITNNEVSGSAAITDGKLAQIVTAGKVSGAAITLLTSLPAAAGVIPAANLPAGATIAFPGTIVLNNVTVGIGYVDVNLSAVVGANRALVLVGITSNELARTWKVRENGNTAVPSVSNVSVQGTTRATAAQLWVMTDAAGIIEIDHDVAGDAGNCYLWVEAYLKV